jgi:hypothetical protein
MHGGRGGLEGPARPDRAGIKLEALGAMKKLLTLALLVGVFAGGYHLGHRPDAPDLPIFAKHCAVQAVDIGGRVARWASAQWEQMKAASDDPALASASSGAPSQEK